jgi:hypothetical protein
MLEYLYMPETDTFVRENCPIRDIASIWDLEKLERFLNRHELLPVIDKSLQHYKKYVIAHDGYMILDPERLGEPSSIAHSAFMTLSLLHAPSGRHNRRVGALAQGILEQQRPNGSFKIHFNDLPDHGEEFYAGEAMLALLESYPQLRNRQYLDSAQRGFSYYDAQYFRRDRVTEDGFVFFANWQSQACRLLYEYTGTDTLKKGVADFVFRMHDRIIADGFYERVRQHPGQQGFSGGSQRGGGFERSVFPRASLRRCACRALPPMCLHRPGIPASTAEHARGNRKRTRRLWLLAERADPEDRCYWSRSQRVHEECRE